LNLDQVKNIIEAIDEKIVLINNEGNVVYTTDSFLNHLEYKKSEINNLKIFDWDLKLKNYKAFEETVSKINEGKISIESNHKTKNGKTKLVVENITKLEFDSVFYFMIKIQDITKKNELEEKYESLLEKFNSVFYNNHTVMMIIHPETGKIIDVNEAAEKFYGIDKETFIKNLYVYDFNVDKTISSLKDFRIAGSKGNNTFLAKHITKNGNIRDVEISAGKINLRGKNLIFTIVYDITDKINYAKEAEIFKHAFAQSPNTIAITDHNGKIIFVNDAFVKNTGYESNEVLSRTAKFLFSQKLYRNYYPKIREAFLSGANWSGELLLQKKNGELVWHSVIISSINDEFGIIKYFLIMAEDISEKKELIKRLEIAKEESELANKVKTDFLIQLSHEIRNPFHVLLNFIDLIVLDEKINLDSDYKVLYQSTIAASERIKKTINLLSDMAVLNANQYSPKKEKVNISKDILYVVRNEYLKTCEDKKIKLIIETNYDELEIETDKYCLLQILSNVVDNAVKFTSNGTVFINAAKNDNELIINVQDTGIGISEQFLPFVYDEFSQENKGYNRAYSGNGLGLAIVKKYCKLIGAEISITSEKNIGTRVDIKIKT